MNKMGLAEKLKDKLIYLITFIYSIYTSYLICRIYILNIKGIVCISIANIIASMFLTYLWKKHVNFNQIKSKSKIIIAIITVFISIIILLLNLDLLTYKYTDTSISVHADNLDISKNNIIKELVLNNITYSVKENTVYNNLEQKDTKAKITIIDEHTLKVDIDKCIDIKLVLNKQNEGISILDGKDLSTIQFKDNTYTYNVISNRCTDNYYIIRFVLSFLAVTYIVGLLITAIVYINNAGGGSILFNNDNYMCDWCMDIF